MDLEKPKEQKIKVPESIYCPSLTKEQIHALAHVSEIAHKESLKALGKQGSLIKIARNLRISRTSLIKTLLYIRDAQITIHLTLETLKIIVTDTHYRNQFETKTSGGKLDYDMRIKWENDLFGGAYNESQAFDRCKYECLNMNPGNRPVTDAGAYGDNYLILKSGIRARVTCCYGDSSDLTNKNRVGTLDNYAHILSQFSDYEIQEIVNLANGISKEVEAHMSYKEVQIHGPIVLRTDIEALVIHHRYKYKENPDLCKLVEKFTVIGIRVIESDP